MTFEIALNLLIGIVAGTISGLIPGVGNSVTMMMLFPYLITLSPVELIAFYIALVSTSQYIGSVVATVFAIPGESSSLPAVREGHALFLKGRGTNAISGAAIGSFFGSTLVVVLTLLLVPFLDNFIYFFTTKVQAVVLALVILSLCFSHQQRVLTSIIFVAIGYMLGLIGCRILDGSCFGVEFFGYNPTPNLRSGLPLISVVCALYVVPQIVKNWEHKPVIIDNINNYLQTGNFFENLMVFVKSMKTAFRSSMIGYVCGLFPGFSTTIASHTAYAVERRIEIKKETYSEGNYNSLVAAETANNAAAFTTLIPLFVFGIPMALSETILYEMAASKGFVLGNPTFSFGFFLTLSILLFIVNFVSIFIAWPFAKYLCYFYKIPMKAIYLLILCIIIYIVYYTGNMNWAPVYYLSVFFILLPFGILLRKFDTLPMIFTFVIQSRLDEIVIRIIDFIK